MLLLGQSNGILKGGLLVVDGVATLAGRRLVRQAVADGCRHDALDGEADDDEQPAGCPGLCLREQHTVR